MSLDSLKYGYGYNPYSVGTNTDFMSAQYFQGLQNQQQTQPTTSVNFEGRGDADTFNGKGLVLTAAGAGGAAWYAHSKASPFTEGGKFVDDLINAANSNFHDAKRLEIAENLLAAEKAPIFAGEGIRDAQHYDAIKKFAEVGDRTKLTPSQQALVASITDVDAKNIVSRVEPQLNAIKLDDIAKKATEQAREFSLKVTRENIATNNAAKTLVEGLADTATADDIEKLIKENPKSFGITATEEAKIAAEAKTLATGQTKASLLTTIDDELKIFTARETALVDDAGKTLSSYWDDAAKAFKKDTPEAITKGLKNFKWKQAGKWGLIAAGIGLAFNWAFGGNKG